MNFEDKLNEKLERKLTKVNDKFTNYAKNDASKSRNMTFPILGSVVGLWMAIMMVQTVFVNDDLGGAYAENIETNDIDDVKFAMNKSKEPIKSTEPIKIVKEESKVDMNFIKKEYKKAEPLIKIRSYNELKIAVRMRESSNNQYVVNRFGYMGWYQFGRSTLKTIGMGKVTRKQFLSSKKLQDEAFFKLLMFNKKVLKKYIRKYNGKKVGGIHITESGILMGAHLRGGKWVKKFLKSNGKINKTDGNGTPVSEYIKKFGSYEIITNIKNA